MSWCLVIFSPVLHGNESYLHVCFFIFSFSKWLLHLTKLLSLFGAMRLAGSIHNTYVFSNDFYLVLTGVRWYAYTPRLSLVCFFVVDFIIEVQKIFSAEISVMTWGQMHWLMHTSCSCLMVDCHFSAHHGTSFLEKLIFSPQFCRFGEASLWNFFWSSL